MVHLIKGCGADVVDVVGQHLGELASVQAAAGGTPAAPATNSSALWRAVCRQHRAAAAPHGGGGHIGDRDIATAQTKPH